MQAAARVPDTSNTAQSLISETLSRPVPPYGAGVLQPVLLSIKHQHLSCRRDWVEQTDRTAQRRLESLEAELNVFKTNLIKESIRMGHNELGNFHYARGNLQVRSYDCKTVTLAPPWQDIRIPTHVGPCYRRHSKRM